MEGTNDKEGLVKLQSRYRQEQDRVVAALAEAFRRSDLGKAAALSTELRYIGRIIEQIVEKL